MKITKKIFYFTLCGLVFLIFSVKTYWWLYDKVEIKKEIETNYTLNDSEIDLLQNGDIILRYGFGMISDMVVDEFDEEFPVSHCGIVYRDSDSIGIVHSESSSYFKKEGVQYQELQSFVNASHPNSVIVVRYKNITTFQQNSLQNRTLSYLKANVPFDYSFDMNTKNELYCSELIKVIFEDEFGVDIYTFDNPVPNYERFYNYLDTNHFEVIINHHLR